MKFSDKQKYTLYIGVILIALMALFVHEFIKSDNNKIIDVENTNIEIYDSN